MAKTPKVWVVLNSGYSGTSLAARRYWPNKAEARKAAKRLAKEHGWPPMFVVAVQLTQEEES